MRYKDLKSLLEVAGSTPPPPPDKKSDKDYGYKLVGQEKPNAKGLGFLTGMQTRIGQHLGRFYAKHGFQSVIERRPKKQIDIEDLKNYVKEKRKSK